ncbi:MAG: class I SAM-dependent methyltransferase [Oscillospiraceae bacterium]|jgi:tRNA (adenine22-N1)-methyltransferase|nr:class I SAM-dependent methyltransferase [Oscillospiraceae bacterium]
MNLPRRLLAAVGFVRKGAAVYDVGTDHAALPCYLALNGFSPVYACDVNEGPLRRAEARIKRLGANVVLLRSDGLESVPGFAPGAGNGENAARDVIIAGMGGGLIADIVGKLRVKDENLRLILQPMSRHEDLRRGLYASGFGIIAEKAVAERGRLYVVIHAKVASGAARISDAEAFVGTSGDLEYIRRRVAVLEKMGRGDARFTRLAESIKEKYPI